MARVLVISFHVTLDFLPSTNLSPILLSFIMLRITLWSTYLHTFCYFFISNLFYPNFKNRTTLWCNFQVVSIVIDEMLRNMWDLMVGHSHKQKRFPMSFLFSSLIFCSLRFLHLVGISTFYTCEGYMFYHFNLAFCALFAIYRCHVLKLA